jgi:exopolysaccharide biosynthesis predicted pyruvyltransferase EpsI
MTTAPDALVAGLARRIDAVVGPLLDGVEQVALVDFPNHINIGDAAIWLGELAFLRSRAVRIAYTCDQRGYVADHLRRSMPSGVILLHGGGNLGDIYPRHQRLRERVIEDFPDYPIVQLPQTMTFEDPGNLRRAAHVFNGHERLTVLLRDTTSVERFARDFSADVHLCPDMAFCLGDLSPVVRGTPAARGGVLWLARTDGEEVFDHVDAGDGVRRVDWPGPSSIWRRRRYASRLLSSGVAQLTGPGRVAWRPAAVMFPRLAGERVRSGAALLSSAEVVVTDRLHGHILSLLCRVPHVLNDNRTGKIRAFYQTWTEGSSLTHWAAEPAEALAVAHRLTERRR